MNKLLRTSFVGKTFGWNGFKVCERTLTIEREQGRVPGVETLSSEQTLWTQYGVVTGLEKAGEDGERLA